jgi:hypothetical protein
MANFEEELRLDEEENLRELAYIRNVIPTDLSYHYSNSDILWILDAIVDYYYSSGILESEEEEIDIDMELVAEYVCQKARETNTSQSFSVDDVVLIVQADLDFQEQNLS